MLSDPAFVMMSGIKSITEQIEPYLKRTLKRKRQLFYTKCTKLITMTATIDTSNVQQAVPQDAEQLVELLTSIPEFCESIVTVERKRRALEIGTSRTFYIREDGKMVASTSTYSRKFSFSHGGRCWYPRII